jgi:hypothetical protein
MTSISKIARTILPGVLNPIRKEEFYNDCKKKRARKNRMIFLRLPASKN